MSNDIIYSKGEKEVRRYNVFQGKGALPEKRGLDLIITNKRIISKSYIKGAASGLSEMQETPLSSSSGDIHTSVARKVKVWKVIVYIFAALWFLSISARFDFEEFMGTICLLGFFGMIALIVLAFVFPETEGKIYIPGVNNVHEGVYSNAGTISKKNKGVALYKIQKGRDFDLMQREVGCIIEEIKNGTNIDELIVRHHINALNAQVQNLAMNNLATPVQTAVVRNEPVSKNISVASDDDEIPLL